MPNLGHLRKTVIFFRENEYNFLTCCLFKNFRDRSFSKGMDTSEETSDTCVDDHHDVSSGIMFIRKII